MEHRDRHRNACEKLFQGFVPDVTKAKEPDLILRVRDLAAQGMFSYEIAPIVGKSPNAVQKIFRRYDFPRLHNLEPPILSERPGWNGGTKLMKGYLYVRSPGHRNATTHGSYVAEHRLVMEKSLGRLLTADEVVDHIDGDITNNDPSNLRVFSSNGEHLKETLKGKVPQWSADGKRRIARALRERHRKTREMKQSASHA